MSEEPRDLLGAYRDTLRELQRNAGPLGPLMSPLLLQADVVERLLRRQGELEARVASALSPFASLAELTRDAPAALRTNAKAFEAASVSFKQAADVMNLQADVLERTLGALNVPGGIIRQLRGPADG
jgi:hypothetical protein